MKKLKLAIKLIFADKFMLITGENHIIETNYQPNEISTSGNALYFRTITKV